MTEAARQAPSLSRPTWILALVQTAGRGRRGRPWTEQVGNFSATLVLPLNEAPGPAALRSFTMSLALRRTLADYIAAERLSLKWPNDVLLDNGKLAGILLESSSTGGTVGKLSIGVGVNLVAAPDVAQVEPGAVAPVSISGQGGAPLSPQETLLRLGRHFAELEQLYLEQGFEGIRGLWLDHAARLGEPIIARMGRTRIHGTFETVDNAGNLILTTSNGPQAIAAADVYFHEEV